FEQLRPRAPQTRAACANARREMLVDSIRNKKLFILGPPIAAFREPDLFVAEWLTVSCCSVLLMRRTIADVAVQNDERRTTLCLSEDGPRLLDPLTIVRVADPQDVPSISEEASRDIFAECQARAPLDCDVVVVVDPAQIVEAEMAGQRCRFGRNTLHQAAITANGIDVVVEDLETGLVVTAGEPLLGDRHPDAGGNALPQGTSRSLDARHPMIFRVTGRLAVELAEPADVVERHRGLTQSFVVGVHGSRAAEMKRRPKQHRSM